MGPAYMYRMDSCIRPHRYWLPAGTLSKMPSEYFRENVYTTFQDDYVAFQVRNLCQHQTPDVGQRFPA